MRAEGIIRARAQDVQELLWHLKQTDEDRFNWITKQYDLQLLPREQDKVNKTQRQQRIDKAKAEFRKVQNEELSKIRAKIAVEREEFNRLKAKELEEISKELDALGVTLADDIDDTLEELGVERTKPSPLQNQRRRWQKYLEISKPVRDQMAQVRQIPEGAEVDLP